MKKSTTLMALCFASATLLYTSCKKEKVEEVVSPAPTSSTPVTKSLYDRVGGTTMVQDPTDSSATQIEQGRLTLRSVVDSSIYVIAADPQMAPYFSVLLSEVGSGNTTGLVALSESFTDFMCYATGSTNPAYTYSGMNMKDAHDPAKNSRMGKKVTDADFDKFVGNIGTGLAQNGVTSANSKELVDDLVALLYTTKGDIVQ